MGLCGVLLEAPFFCSLLVSGLREPGRRPRAPAAAAMSHARKSMAGLADKYNTAAPPGYVPGAGRGISGFSKPPPKEPPKRGSDTGGPDKFGKFGAPVPDGTSSAAAAGAASLETDGKGLAGDAGDTRELDLAETQGVEEQDLSMDSKEAGYAVEAFNMNSERQEGHFDDDFNYVWKDKKGDDDDVKDAWLTEVDGDDKETDEKVAKRRKMLQSQMSNLEAPAEVADTAALRRAAAALLQPKESVARGLKRLSAKPKPKPRQGKERREAAKAAKAAAAGGGGGGEAGGEAGGEGEGESAEERAANKALFEQLTEAADQLLRAGDHDIYGATKEKLLEAAAKAEAEAVAAAAAAAAAAEVEASTAATDGAGAEAALPSGVSAAVHDAAVAGGFLPHTGGLYFNSSSELFFDPSSSLYWPVGASDEGPYFFFDGEKQEFVKYDMGAAAAGNQAPVDGTAQGRGEDMEDEDGDTGGGGGGNEDQGEDPEI